MNKFKLFFLLFALPALVISCSKDDEMNSKRDADVVHTGEKWNITSVEYNLIDQSMSGQTYKNGSKTNVGSFYFDGTKGSFEFDLEGYHKEDLFSFTEDANSITIVTIDQSVGATTNQNVLSISGERTSDTQIVMDGTIIKQSSATGQFVLTASFTLVKN